MAWQASPEKAIEDYIAESNERDRLVGTPDYQIELFTREETLVKQPKPSINYLTISSGFYNATRRHSTIG